MQPERGNVSFQAGVGGNHHFRNLKSNLKVALHFISGEGSKLSLWKSEVQPENGTFSFLGENTLG